jgi:hypothetical protein
VREGRGGERESERAEVGELVREILPAVCTFPCSATARRGHASRSRVRVREARCKHVPALAIAVPMCSTCARRASACEQVVRAASECEQHRRGGNATELSTPVVQLHFHDIAVRSSRHRVSVTRTSLLNPHQRLRTVWRPAPRPVPHHPKIGRSSGVDLSAQTANCRRRRLKDKRTLPHRQSGRDSSSAP